MMIMAGNLYRTGYLKDPLFSARIVLFFFILALLVPWSTAGADNNSAELLDKGERLFEMRGCMACHPKDEASRKFAPPLNGIGGKLKEQRWLPAWLLSPRSIRPGTMMPDFGMKPSVACDISAFLMSLDDPHGYGTLDLSGGSVTNGRHLFTYRGCRACHITAYDKDAQVSRIPALSDAGIKLNPDWILMELEDPRAYNPDARIPLLELPRNEVIDIITYLTTLTISEAHFPPEVTACSYADARKGRDHVARYGCYGCHNIAGFGAARPPGKELDTLGRHALPKEGKTPRSWESVRKKISPPKGLTRENGMRRMPVFNLSESEIRALVTFLMQVPTNDAEKRFVPESRVQHLRKEGEQLLADYHCHNCHVVESGSVPHVSEVIDRAHLLPPRLVDEGARVQPQWLAAFLKKPFAMRIWMSMHMPYFYLENSETETLVRWFRGRVGFEMDGDLVYSLPFDAREISSEEQAMGQYRFQHDKCIQCHPSRLDQGLPSGVAVDDLAIDLMLTKERLRYEWVRKFLRNPDQFAGINTRMPFIYFTPDGVPKVPDASEWLDRVARFLFLMDALPDEPLKNTHKREDTDVSKFWEDY